MVFHFLLDLFFPKKCVGCGKEGIWLCQECLENILKEEATPLRLVGKLDGLVIGASFKGVLREAIHAFKYEGVKELALPLAQIIVERLTRFDFPFLESVLIPVPLFKKKQASRGFNQATLLARVLQTELELTLLEDRLIKVKNTPSQTTLEPGERKKMVKGVFCWQGAQEEIQGKTVFLVDDVITTGATLNECAKVLKRTGAQSVWGLAVAKG